jgi:CelD/BcsL family acetyltransferase involved in cellulose biosynthesis
MKWTILPAARFQERAEDWAALHAAAGSPALLAPAFVAPLLAAFARGDELLALCRDGGGVVAMAVLAPTRRGAWATFQPAQAPVGLWLQLPGLDTGALVRQLFGALPGFPLVCALTQMDPMMLPRPGDGPAIRTLDYIDTARVTLAGGFDAYWEARGKNLRGNLKKQRNRLEREGIATRLEIARAPDAMAQAVLDYSRLEGSGWKAGAGTAVRADEAQGRYYRAMLEAMAGQDGASVYRYYFGERLVAMDLCVEDRGGIVVLKTAYDETVPASLSPALLMREEAMRALFEDGRFERLEFYGRVMEWHTRWTEEVRTMYHVNHYRWPALRHLHALQEARRRRAANAPTDEQRS